MLDTLKQIAALVASLPHGVFPTVRLGVSAEARAALLAAGATATTHVYEWGAAIDEASLTVGGVQFSAADPERSQ